MNRRMRLGLSMAGAGEGATGAALFENILRRLQLAESAGFDFALFPDEAAAAVGGAFHAGLEPLTLLSALAAVTRHVGLIATASTRLQDPFHLARKLASIDHLSGGRAGWNLATAATGGETRNFGLPVDEPAAALDARAREFLSIVRRLFVSWDADAFPRDLASGIYMDRAKMHRLEHAGAHYKVRGPLDVAQPPQGEAIPVMTSATTADAQDFAAEFADIVHDRPATADAARAQYRAVKARLSRHGRPPESLLMMPGVTPLVAGTQQRADDLRGALYDRADPDEGPDARGAIVAGTPAHIADILEGWIASDAADGFVVLTSGLPGGVEDFVALVVPELQRRDLVGSSYEAATLRGYLGL
ncbi:MAG: LLM class flavin-dependent oxidoreductase [Proteobacteria bacterium]|nr:LLM class flavin-dependent oxidoreductase [Pseudomonadota bacterium]